MMALIGRMKITWCWLFCIIISSTYSQAWFQIADFPSTKRDDGVAVTVGNKGYFGTGLEEWSATIDFRVLDFESQTWSIIPNMPHTTERQYACAFAEKNSFYVFGGYGVGGPLNSLYQFDINSNTWLLKSPKPGQGITGASCMAFGDSIIIIGGRTNAIHSTNNEVWLYKISNDSWTKRNDFTHGGRWRGSASVLNNKGYFMFGLDSNNIYRKEVFRYDLQNDIWVQLPDFPQTIGRTYSALVAASKKLVLFGGVDSLKNYYNDLWYYNDVTNNWFQGNSLPSAGRKGGMCCSDGNNIFYSCGISKTDTRLTETWMTDVPLGIQNSKLIKGTGELIIYPNPIDDLLNVELQIADFKFSNLQIEIVNAFGQSVLNMESSRNNAQIDTKDLNKGIYFVEIKDENRIIHIKKIVKN